MTQPMPGKPAEDAENELDIRGLFRTLWAGKLWIIGMGLAFALIALAYTFFARQEWSSTAITDRPTVNMLGGYYSQQQFLRNLDARSNMASADQPSVMDEAYKEFVMQLASWDTRREFWLQTDYYKQRMVGNSKADAALLDEMINNIQFIPGDFTRAVNDSVKLIAETAPDANNLLRQYVAFASQRAASHLNDELKGAWAARTIQMKAQVKRQEEVAKAIYDRRMNSIEQALKIAEQHNISRSATDVPAEELPDSEMFLLGRPMLQARLENLQAVGPAFDLDYDQFPDVNPLIGTNQRQFISKSDIHIAEAVFGELTHFRRPRVSDDTLTFEENFVQFAGAGRTNRRHTTNHAIVFNQLDHNLAR